MVRLDFKMSFGSSRLPNPTHVSVSTLETCHSRICAACIRAERALAERGAIGRMRPVIRCSALRRLRIRAARRRCLIACRPSAKSRHAAETPCGKQSRSKEAQPRHNIQRREIPPRPAGRPGGGNALPPEAAEFTHRDAVRPRGAPARARTVAPLGRDPYTRPVVLLCSRDPRHCDAVCPGRWGGCAPTELV